MKLFIAILFCIVSSFLGVSSVSAASPLPTTAPPPPPLNWQPCEGVPVEARRDCATLVVPLDYADLTKGNIELPVARARASESAGTPLIYEPGGPGISVVGIVGFSNISRSFSPELLSKFDIVGLNSRGVTDGILCFDNQTQTEYWKTNHLPRTTTEIDAILNLEYQANQRCLDNNQPLVNHVDTASHIRDLEQLRRALNIEKINFMGRSYGTFIGNRYIKLYPGKMRAMVLDASYDRSISDLQFIGESTYAHQQTWNQFKTWCQETTSCRLRGEDIDALLNQILNQARTTPIPAPYNPFGNRAVNDWMLTLALEAAAIPGSITFAWIDEMITKARAGDASLASLIYDSATNYRGNNVYGLGGTHRAITCVDTQWSQILRNTNDVKTVAFGAKVISPRFGEVDIFQSPVQCAGYLVSPVEPAPLSLKVTGEPTVLVIGATQDASTPFIWAKRMAEQISDSRLIKREGEGHVSYMKSRCVQQHVDRYLIDLTVPPTNSICNTDPDLYPPQPVPVLGPQSTQGTDDSLPDVITSWKL